MGSYKDSLNHAWSRHFPAVAKFPIARTSDKTGDYNCFAYVAGIDSINWCPHFIKCDDVYWPAPECVDENHIDSYLIGYERIGFEWCADGSLEAGWEKIALYVDEKNIPQHAAVQREDGTWQSKLGSDIDVSHALESLESSEEFGKSPYGTAKFFMRRRRTQSPGV